MIYRETPRSVEGVYNRSVEWTATSHIQMYAENLTDLQAWLATNPRKWDAECSKSNAKAAEWDLGAGYDGAVKMAREGWSEGALNIDAKLQAIIPASGRESRWGYGESGTSVNVARYLSGHPKAMRTRRKKLAGGSPVLQIVVNGTASCMITANQMANYGTALVGLIDRLENSGRRVHLDVMFCSKERDARVAFGWNVKRSSEAVDLSAIAFSLAHPAAFRRLGFAMLERTNKASECGGYGYSCDLSHDDLIDGDERIMLIDGISHEPSRCNSETDALRYAVEQINKAAVIAGHATVDDPLIDADEEMFA